MTPTQYRQGDVLLQRIVRLPPTVRQATSDGPCILAYGEASGHTHQVRSGGRLWTDARDGETRVLEVTTITVLEHEEHAPIRLGPGLYEVIRQEEYAPGKRHSRRRVMD
jgi:hypothetical protein